MNSSFKLHPQTKFSKRTVDKNIISPESVLHWLKNDLGYRHKCGSLVDDVNESELTKEEIQKLCRNNEFASIFKFLMEHIKSSKEVLQYKKSKVAIQQQQQQQQSLRTHHQSRRNIQHKSKLEKKLAQTLGIVEEGEMQTKQMISQISDIESHIKKVKGEIREKENKIYMKEIIQQQQQQQQSLRTHHQSRRNIQHKSKLEKKLAQTLGIVEEGEMQTKQMISQISDIESHIKKVKGEIREKENKIYMKEMFRENCRLFGNEEIEYGKLFEEYKIMRKRTENGGTGINFLLKGIETTLTIKIKNICDKLKHLVQEMIFSQSFSDNGTKTNIRFLMEDLLRKTPPNVLFKSISFVMESAMKESNARSEQSIKKMNSIFVEMSNQIQPILQNFRINHASKFIEIESILNNIMGIKEQIYKTTESTRLFLKRHAPDMMDQVILVLEKKAESEAIQAALNIMLHHTQRLESRYQELSNTSRDQLIILRDQVVNSNKIIEHKQNIIQRQIFINQHTKTKFIEQSNEIARFMREDLYPFSKHLNTLTKNLDCTMLKENEQFNNIDLKLALQVKIDGNLRIVNSLDIYRVRDEKLFKEFKNIIQCPKHLDVDTFFKTIADLKFEDFAYELIRNNLTRNIQSCHNQMENMANNLLKMVQINGMNRDDKTISIYRKTTSDIRNSVEKFKDMMESLEETFMNKQIPRIENKFRKSEIAETIFQEIVQILEDRENIFNGQIGSRMIIQGIRYCDMMKSCY
ncbi:hypothetical protein Glove_454g19 [Diversispora epigaea]|uniref:Uncharacterized protein n=1 Tax=Diversispora epigaea TaxID=1348612 RepID=A0A397GV51_9GLOM|nr:hypothetical protein Glove_454g19 [Diversispora epigaea]